MEQMGVRQDITHVCEIRSPKRLPLAGVTGRADVMKGRYQRRAGWAALCRN